METTNEIPLAEMRALVDESREPCPTCHCSNALNPHRMDKHKVSLLSILGKALRASAPWCRVEEGRGVQVIASGTWKQGPYRCRAHASRLGWFGLAEHEGHRVPHWKITPEGLLFLKGEGTVPARILCRGGVVVYSSSERVSIDDVKDVDLDAAYWDAYPWSDFIKGEEVTYG